MKEAWYSSIPRLIAVLVAILLYGVALFSIFRRRKRIKMPVPEDASSIFPLGYSGPERRIYPRVKLSIDIRYRRCGKRAGLNVFREGRAVDISEGGIGILLETNEKLAVNDKLELKLKLPVASQFMLIRGDIVWMSEIEVERWYRYGITFTEIDPADKKIIAKYVLQDQPEKVHGG